MLGTYIDKKKKIAVQLDVTNPGDMGDIHFRGPAGMTSMPSKDFYALYESQLPAPNTSAIPTIPGPAFGALWGGASDEIIARLDSIIEGQQQIVDALQALAPHVAPKKT